MKTSRFATDFSVGFVLFVATLIVIAGLFLVGSGHSLFSDHVEYRVRVPSASGLRTGSRVYLSGVHVGSVTRISFAADLTVSEVELTISVDDRYAERIREDSYVWLQSEGLLGDISIQLRLGTTGKPVCPPDSVLAYRERPLVEELVGERISTGTADLLGETLTMLEELNRGEGTVGQLLKNPQLYENLNEFTVAMKDTMRHVERLSTEFEDVLKEVRGQRGTLGKLIFSPEYAAEFSKALDDAAAVLGNVRELTDAARSGRGGVGNLLVRLERSAEHLERILGMIDRGEGSVGMLVRDPSIAASLRDVFLGVQEYGLVQSIVRSAERAGREAYLRDLGLAAEAAREARRARALAQVSGTEGPVEDTATVTPAAMKDGAGAAPGVQKGDSPDDASEDRKEGSAPLRAQD